VLFLAGLSQALAEERAWPEGERKTVAYAVFGVDGVSRAREAWEGPIGGFDDPFDGQGRAANPLPSGWPVRLREPPPTSRFLGAGAELWDVTSVLAPRGIAASKDSWAIYNDQTQRVVLNATRPEHERMGFLMKAAVEHMPKHIEVRMRLLKVRAREMAGVWWGAKEVRERGAVQWSSMIMTGRPGQLVTADLRDDRAMASVRVEANCGPGDRLVDLRLDYDAKLEGEGAPAAVRIATGMTILNGRELFLECGSPDDPEHTWLLGVRCVVRLIDGTPSWRWTEHEERRDQPDLRPGVEEPRFEGEKLDDGMFLGTWRVPPTILSDLRTGEEDPDPSGSGPSAVPAPPELSSRVVDVAAPK
jgi:hypothetical protein